MYVYMNVCMYACMYVSMYVLGTYVINFSQSKQQRNAHSLSLITLHCNSLVTRTYFPVRREGNFEASNYKIFLLTFRQGLVDGFRQVPIVNQVLLPHHFLEKH